MTCPTTAEPGEDHRLARRAISRAPAAPCTVHRPSDPTLTEELLYRTPAGVNVGLSEIILATRTSKGQAVYAVIQRDNQLAFNGHIKRV